MKDDRSFLDTSGWMALLNADDQLHAAAVSAWLEIRRRRGHIVVTDWVVAETGNGLAGTNRRQAFAQAVRMLPVTPEFHLIKIDEALLMSAVELYEARPDKTWGLVDCASFVVMDQEGIRDAITADRHFRQAGFRCLLSDPDGKSKGSNGTSR